MIASAAETAGAHAVTHVILADHADLAVDHAAQVVIHVVLQAVEQTHAASLLAVVHAAQPHLAHLDAQVIHLAAHQHNANHVHLVAQLDAQLAAHKV